MVLLHEAQHLKGGDEKAAYSFVWQNRERLGWTQLSHGTTPSYITIEQQTREFAPELFTCRQNLWSDCTETLACKTIIPITIAYLIRVYPRDVGSDWTGIVAIQRPCVSGFPERRQCFFDKTFFDLAKAGMKMNAFSRQVHRMLSVCRSAFDDNAQAEWSLPWQ